MFPYRPSSSLFGSVCVSVCWEAYDGGIQKQEGRITNLRYVDDIMLLVGSEIELQEMVNRLDRARSRQGLLINVDKTKAMVIANVVFENSDILRLTSVMNDEY